MSFQPEGNIADVRVIDEIEWRVKRYGRVEEVVFDTNDGERIRFRVKIWDHGRNAFITEYFNDITPASDFRDRVMEENEAAFRERTRK